MLKFFSLRKKEEPAKKAVIPPSSSQQVQNNPITKEEKHTISVEKHQTNEKTQIQNVPNMTIVDESQKISNTPIIPNNNLQTSDTIQNSQQLPQPTPTPQNQQNSAQQQLPVQLQSVQNSQAQQLITSQSTLQQSEITTTEKENISPLDLVKEIPPKEVASDISNAAVIQKSTLSRSSSKEIIPIIESPEEKPKEKPTTNEKSEQSLSIDNPKVVVAAPSQLSRQAILSRSSSKESLKMEDDKKKQTPRSVQTSANKTLDEKKEEVKEVKIILQKDSKQLTHQATKATAHYGITQSSNTPIKKKKSDFLVSSYISSIPESPITSIDMGLQSRELITLLKKNLSKDEKDQLTTDELLKLQSVRESISKPEWKELVKQAMKEKRADELSTEKPKDFPTLYEKKLDNSHHIEQSTHTISKSQDKSHHEKLYQTHNKPNTKTLEVHHFVEGSLDGKEHIIGKLKSDLEQDQKALKKAENAVSEKLKNLQKLEESLHEKEKLLDNHHSKINKDANLSKEYEQKIALLNQRIGAIEAAHRMELDTVRSTYTKRLQNERTLGRNENTLLNQHAGARVENFLRLTERMRQFSNKAKEEVVQVRQSIAQELTSFGQFLDICITRIAQGDLANPAVMNFNNISGSNSSLSDSFLNTTNMGSRSKKQRSYVYARVLPLDQVSKPSVVIVDAHNVEIPKAPSFADGMDSKLRFSFDRVFGPIDSHEDVFEELSFTMKHLFNGSNRSICVLAYGYTLGGKSDLIYGNGKNGTIGLCSLFLQSIFQEAQTQENMTKHRFSISAIEVKGEFARDLLSSKCKYTKSLNFKQAQRLPCDSYSHSMHHLKQIVRNLNPFKERNNGALYSLANDVNPFSHFIITVNMESVNAVTLENTVSQLSFVELASSQALNPKLKGQDIYKEYKVLQKQFGSLVEVIHGLKNAKPDAHIPWRNSNITSLLRECLQTSDPIILSFICLRPKWDDYQENMRALKYGANLKSSLAINMADSTVLEDVQQKKNLSMWA